jgi:hypothetical protein
MTHWFSCAGWLPTFIAGAPLSPLTPPPPPRVFIGIPLPGRSNPRHVAHKDPRELLFLFLPLDLTADDHRRRNMAATVLLCSVPSPGTSD